MPYDNQAAYDRLIFELGSPGRIAYSPPDLDVPVEDVRPRLPQGALRRAYHLSGGEKRTKVLVPDSAHGTNPASTAIAGYEVVQLRSDQNGEVDLGELDRHLGPDVAAFMITMPNTLGMFEPRIVEIIEL